MVERRPWLNALAHLTLIVGVLVVAFMWVWLRVLRPPIWHSERQRWIAIAVGVLTGGTMFGLLMSISLLPVSIAINSGMAGGDEHPIGALVTGGNMEPLEARLDFNLETVPEGFKESIEAACNIEVQANRAIEAYELSRDEAFAIPDIIRTATNLLPPTIEIVRIVDIKGLDVQADGGTRTASICGAYVALHDALTRVQQAGGLSTHPLHSLCAAISVGCAALCVRSNECEFCS